MERRNRLKKISDSDSLANHILAYPKNLVFSFVLEFLYGTKYELDKINFSIFEIVKNIMLEINNNNLRIEGKSYIRLNNKLKIFFENCAYISKRFRNKEIIIGEKMHCSKIINYNSFYFVTESDRRIYNLRKNFRNIFCEDIINYIIKFLI